MALTGVDPQDPRPADRREFVYSTGLSTTSGKQDFVLLFGNKTSAGSETVNVIRAPVVDAADMVARFGRRSELNWLYKKYVEIDQSATIYAIAVPEGAGSAASVPFTFAGGSASAVTSVKIEFLGETVFVAVASGDTAITTAAAVRDAINKASDGEWPVTAAVGGGGSEHIVTVTAANLGPRGDHLLGNNSNRGMRMSFTVSATQTVTKGSLTAGATDDDFTSAIVEMAAGEYTFQVSPKHQNTAAGAGEGSTTAISATDNGIGEHHAKIVELNGANFGKFQKLFLGFVGTQAATTTAAVALNSPEAYLIHQENSDYTPGMIAAQHAAAARRGFNEHPAFNINGYPRTSADPYSIPAFYLKADVPTGTEEKADLNNGACAISQRKSGKPYLMRFVTTKSQNSAGNNDYRTREGHIPFVVEFTWRTILVRWESEKQPMVMDDLPQGAKPMPRYSTPGQLKALIRGVIDDLTGPRPLGLYEGAILAPDKAPLMKNSIVAEKIAGGINASVDIYVGEHLIRMNLKMNQAGAGY